VSVVTDVLLCFHCGEKENVIDPINLWLGEKYNQEITRLDGYATGSKYMQASVYGVAMNHLDNETFVKVVRGCPWLYPEYVQLFMKEEHENLFVDRLARKAEEPNLFGGGQ